MKLFCISDDMMNGYCGPVFEAISDGYAMSQIRSALLQGKNENLGFIIKHQKLIRLADFDRETGVLTPERSVVCDLSSFKALVCPEEGGENFVVDSQTVHEG